MGDALRSGNEAICLSRGGVQTASVFVHCMSAQDLKFREHSAYALLWHYTCKMGEQSP